MRVSDSRTSKSLRSQVCRLIEKLQEGRWGVERELHLIVSLVTELSSSDPNRDNDNEVSEVEDRDARDWPSRVVTLGELRSGEGPEGFGGV